MALHNKIQAKRSKCGPICYKELLFSIKEPKIDGRTVCGYLAVFNNKDYDCDVLIKGCFAKSIAERGPMSQAGNKIAHLWQHQMDKPLGKITKLEEDDYGLYFECVYDDIQRANDALVQIKSGTLDKFSIGFLYVWDKMEYMDYCDKHNCIVMPGNNCPQCGTTATDYCFVCKEINLFEGSLVTLAANDMTYVAGIKSEQKEAEIEVLTAEAEELISGLKPRKQYELRQIISKFIALANVEPADSKKQKLKDENTLNNEDKPQKKGRKLTKLGQL